MHDFVSESSFEVGFVPAEDALGHDALAQRILEKTSLLPPGSVVGVHGEWGRGKTDVVSRIAHSTYGEEGAAEGFASKAIWIDPWQYGTPDLLSPIVVSLLKKIPLKRRSGAKALRKAAESIVVAGLSFGLKSVGLSVQGGKIFEYAAQESKSLLKGLFESLEAQEQNAPDPDPDPVAAMG